MAFMGYSYDDPSHIDKGIVEAEGRIADRSVVCERLLCARFRRDERQEAQSRQAFLRALELDPNNIGAMANFSVMEAWFGWLDDAAYWGRRGVRARGSAPTTTTI